MPRKPTAIARAFRERIIRMAGESTSCLPTVRDLSEQSGLHASTIFRMLRDLTAEGVVWQSSSGRFYPASSRKYHVRGLPIYFIGRELWNWSRLYREILDGVSEVCAANGSPLVLLSSPALVRQTDPAVPPVFASSPIQKKDLAALVPSIPRRCGGIILDHLWGASALTQLKSLRIPMLQLLQGVDSKIPAVGPDMAWIAGHTREYLTQEGIHAVHLVVPFHGDQAIDAAAAHLRSALSGLTVREFTFAQLNGNLSSWATPANDRRCCLVCLEDNTALLLLEQLKAMGAAGRHITLFGIQGTGLLSAPARRLRMDYRRLGRATASKLLHGIPISHLRPALISPHADGLG